MQLCNDILTVIMDYLPFYRCRELLCINKNFLWMKHNVYYKIRILQHFMRKKLLKCFFNDQYCNKINFTSLEKNINNYVGKKIQFILKTPYKTSYICEHNHYTLWECRILSNLYNKAITGGNNGRINFNVFNTCDCNVGHCTFKSREVDPKYSGDIFLFSNIFEFSLRIIK